MNWDLLNNDNDRSNIRARVLRHIDRTGSGCWLWTGRTDRRGYGSMFVRRTHLGIATPVGAHRASYFAFVGVPPQEMHVDHICFVPGCVNPEHLQLLTPQQNMARSRPHPWLKVAACKYGHEYTPENTYTHASGGRWCRACNRRRTAEYKARKKARASA